MLRIGIIGAENSHSGAISQMINVDHLVPGVVVTHLWGETKAFAAATAEKGQIPTIVRRPAEMLGQMDAVMIDHRDGKYHLAAATPFVEAGIPCFIDKPLATSLKEAKAFLALCRAQGVAVTTFSAVTQQACIPGLRQSIDGLGTLRVAHLYGPGNYRGKWGGIFFYGIHCVDLMVELFGTAVKTVEVLTNGAACTMVCQYPNELTATITLHPGGPWGWTVTATGEQGHFDGPVTMDENSYLPGTNRFVEMFRTGVAPYSDERMLAPVAVLEAAAKSIALKKRVKVASLAMPELVG